VPQRCAEAEVVHLGDHRGRIRELRRGEVEGVDAGGVGPVDPVAAGGQVEVANDVEIALHLRLIVVLVAPHHRAQRPAGWQLGVAGDVVVVARDIQRMGGREQVEGQALRRSRAGAEGRLDQVRLAGGDREGAGVRGLHEHAPAIGSHQHGNWHVGVVVSALDLLTHQVHGADLAAVLDGVEVLAQPVKTLAAATARAQPHERRAAAARGEQQREAPRTIRLHAERGAVPLVVLELQQVPARFARREAGPGRRQPRDGERRGVDGMGRVEHVGVVVGVVVDLLHHAELQRLGVEAQQRDAVALEPEARRLGERHGAVAAVERHSMVDDRVVVPTAAGEQQGYRWPLSVKHVR